MPDANDDALIDIPRGRWRWAVGGVCLAVISVAAWRFWPALVGWFTP